MKNKTTLIRVPKNKSNPYTMCSRIWNDHNKLNGYERAILLEIFSNDDSFIINKEVIRKRLDFPRKKFNDSWQSLSEKNFIVRERIFGGTNWLIYEGGNFYVNENNISA